MNIIISNERMTTHLYPDIVWDPLALNQLSHKSEIGVAGSRVGDLDLLEAADKELVKECVLLLNRHRICQRLIPIAKVGGEPYWYFVERFGWPLTIGQLERSIRLVSYGWVCSEHKG